MKLTPLDIHHKEFRHSLRGYSEEEVDAFLDEVADEFERLFKENIDLAERLEAADEKLREHEKMEKTVHNTMVAAQKSAEDIEANAEKEAELVRKDAELRAKEVIHEALTLKQRTQDEFMRIKEAETQFRQVFRRLLEEHLNRLQEIPVPEDIAALSVRQDAAEDLVASMESVQQSPAAVPAADRQSEDLTPARSVEDVMSTELPTDEPPAPGFVTSVQLGEVEDTDLVAETPEYDEEPVEFEMPTLDSLGERDDDLDIEEID